MVADGVPHVFAVLGMHRSGTSFLAGSLQSLGLELGEVNEASQFNEKGNRENADVLAVHGRLFQDLGATWRDPPKHVEWTSERLALIRPIVDEMDARYERWGFKDPRTVFLVEGWEQVVPGGVAKVGIYRHPVAVVASLGSRDAMSVPPKDALRLWCAYNRALVTLHRRRPFPLVRFDQPAAALSAAVERVASSWALPGAGRGEGFFDAGLVHNSERADAAIPLRARRIWSYLERHALTVA